MPQLVALSLSIGVLGGIWTFLALSPLAGFVLVWAGFISWACFFHCGGDKKAVATTITGTAFGTLMAWIALLLIVNVQIEALGVVWIAIVVGVTAASLVIVASYAPLSAIPANVYGYAATFAYALQTPSVPGATAADAGTGPLQNLVSVNFENPLILLPISFAIGAVFGYLSGQLGAAMTKEAAAA